MRINGVFPVAKSVELVSLPPKENIQGSVQQIVDCCFENRLLCSLYGSFHRTQFSIKFSRLVFRLHSIAVNP